MDIGSYPFSDGGRYGTTLVVRGTEEDRLEAVLEELRALIVGSGAEPLERN